MQVNLPPGGRRLWIAFAFAVILCKTGVAANCPTPVEVWSGGADVSTQKLRDALESAFDRSPDFSLSSGGKVGTLVALIPPHVELRRRFWRLRIIYTVEFSTRDKQSIGVSRGSCWEASVAKCAKKVLEDAKTVATKIPQRIEDKDM